MKKLILLLAISFQILAAGDGLLMSGIKPVEGMDYQLELILKEPDDHIKVLLDCQSFINGLHHMSYVDKKWVDNWFYMLSGNDCEEAASQAVMFSSNKILYCVRVIEEEYKIDLSSQIEGCN